MILSGEWFGALALNAFRHRMGSRHAIETVSARSAKGRTPHPDLKENAHVCSPTYLASQR